MNAIKKVELEKRFILHVEYFYTALRINTLNTFKSFIAYLESDLTSYKVFHLICE